MGTGDISNSMNIGKTNTSFKLSGFKGGIKREQIQDAKMQSLFDKVDKDNNKVLTDDEIQDFNDLLKASAEDDNFSNKEIKNFLKDQGFDKKEMTGDDLTNFLSQINSFSEATDIESAQVVQNDDGTNSTVLTSNGGNTVETIAEDFSRTLLNNTENGFTLDSFDENNNLTQNITQDNTAQTTSTTDFQPGGLVDENGNPIKSREEVTGLNFSTVTNFDKNGQETNRTEEKNLESKAFETVNGESLLMKETKNKGLATEMNYEYMYNEKNQKTAEIGTDINGNAIVSEFNPETGDKTKEKTGEYETDYTYNDDGTSTEMTTFSKDKTSQELVKNGDGTVIQDTKIDANGNWTSQTKIGADGKEHTQKYKDGNTVLTFQYGETWSAAAKRLGISEKELKDLNPGVKNLVGGEFVAPGQLSADDPKIRNRQSAEEAKAQYKKVQTDALKDFTADLKYQSNSSNFKDLAKELYAKEGVTPSSAQINFRAAQLESLNKGEKGDITGKELNVKMTEAAAKEILDAQAKIEDENKAKEDELNIKPKYTQEEIQQKTEEIGEKVLGGIRGFKGYGAYSNIISKGLNVLNNTDGIMSALGSIDDPELYKSVCDYLDKNLSDGQIGNINDVLKRQNIDPADCTTVEKVLLGTLHSATNDHTDARKVINKMLDNGAYGGKAATDKARAKNCAREIEFELHGGYVGYTGTADLKDAINMANNPESRKMTEEIIKNKHPELQANNGSYVRTFIKADGWDHNEVNMFDAVWVKNNAYSHEEDQEHRDKVISNLLYTKEKEYVATAADAIDLKSQADVDAFEQTALDICVAMGLETGVQRKPSTALFNAVAEDAGDLDYLNSSYYHDGNKPPEALADEQIRYMKEGNYSHVFSSTDENYYLALQDRIADGQIKGCSSLQDLYKNSLIGKDTGEIMQMKSNALLSGQIEFTDKEKVNLCADMMQYRSKRNYFTSGADEAQNMEANFERIIHDNPQIGEMLQEEINKRDFVFTYSDQNGNLRSIDCRGKVQDLFDKAISNSVSVANESVYVGNDGNQITDDKAIQELKDIGGAYVQELKQQRNANTVEFDKIRNDQGWSGNVANDVAYWAGIGTTKEDVERDFNAYDRLTNEMSLAFEGKLRDKDGNPINPYQAIYNNLSYLENSFTPEEKQKFANAPDGDKVNMLLDKYNNKMNATISAYNKTQTYGKAAVKFAPVIIPAAFAGSAATLPAMLGWSITTGVVAAGISYSEAATSNKGVTHETSEAALEEAITTTAQTFGAAGIGKGFDKLSDVITEGRNFSNAGQKVYDITKDVVQDFTAQVATTGDFTNAELLIKTPIKGQATKGFKKTTKTMVEAFGDLAFEETRNVWRANNNQSLIQTITEKIK